MSISFSIICSSFCRRGFPRQSNMPVHVRVTLILGVKLFSGLWLVRLISLVIRLFASMDSSFCNQSKKTFLRVQCFNNWCEGGKRECRLQICFSRPNNCSIFGQPIASIFVTGNFKYSANETDICVPFAKKWEFGFLKRMLSKIWSKYE